MVHSETGCQLYLILPSETNRDAVLSFAQGGGFGAIACAVLQSGPDGELERGYVEQLLRLAHDANIPLLLENDISAAADLGVDGVHISADEELYLQARKALGDDAIIGAHCGLSRHDGLTFAELGADYVAFKGTPGPEQGESEAQLEEIITWWSQTVTVPCIAWDIFDAHAAKRLAGLGADFVALGNPIWSHPEGAAAATAELHAQLTRAAP